MKIHYLFDPLCGWCYGASRLVHALSERLAPVAPLQLWPGALFPEPVTVERGMRAHIVQADARIHALTGAMFGKAYVERIGNPANTVTLWSVPVIAAIALGQSQERLALLEAMQRAHYVDGLDLADPEVLAGVAVQAGVDPARYEATMRSPAHAQATAMWIRQSQALMEQSGARGFPTFLVEKGGSMMLVDHQAAYRDPAALIAHIEGLAAR